MILSLLIKSHVLIRINDVINWALKMNNYSLFSDNLEAHTWQWNAKPKKQKWESVLATCLSPG